MDIPTTSDETTATPATPSLRAFVGVSLAICAAAAFAGTALALEWHRTPVARGLLLAAAVGTVGWTGVRWLRKGRVRVRIRRYARAAVQDHGGGAYGVVALATWLYLEAMTLRGDWMAAGGAAGLLDRRLPGWLFGFSVESVLNAVWASLWPMTLFTRFGFVTLAVVAAAAFGGEAIARRMIAARRPAA